MSKQIKGIGKYVKGFKRKWLIGIGIFSICVVLVSVLLTSGPFALGSKTKVSADLLKTRLEDISELATVNYHYKNMGLFENNTDFYGVTIPFTTKKFILSYSGEIKAGVDLKDLKIDVSGKKITMTLPEAKIFSHTIDEKSIVVFDEKSSLFNPLKITDMTGFTADQKDKIEKEAIDNGLLTKANEEAKKRLKSTLALDKERLGDYEIVFQ